MTPSARVSAAIEILGVTFGQRRPLAEALKDWGIAHRFAGSKDRAAIANLAFDALRVRASSAYAMGSDEPRALLIGALHDLRGLDVAGMEALFSGERFAPEPLNDAERARIGAWLLEGAPDHIAGNYPDWLAPSLGAAFGADAVEEGRALATRAPVDLRVNVLKGARDKARKLLEHLEPEPTPLSPYGLRIAVGSDGRGPSMLAETAYVKGLVEVQDEGSQIAALLAAAKSGEQVLDLCAGGGGKTLALAAQMDNRGQIYAHDSDGRRLTPIFDRLERSGARNVQTRPPRGQVDVLADLAGRCDLVFVDAPCTGTGVWRRHPDAKWRMRPGALETRRREQEEVLANAVRFVKPGGRIVYVTCSILIEENEAQAKSFLEQHPNFTAVPAEQMAKAAGLPDLARFASAHGPGLRLSPRTAGTDGFYVAVLMAKE
ncbi:RsmB/NOP family class I SAM-dependent RNA methyltransferase [Methylovirgula sp. 4M-Z18]|uniref:RsmB/NOP family class I SAM-dependent RNA methyltransferase n=1 Tax=Methylovirgula sp. 4M-Z18 TaxID=2293567 RepID=UPI000E2F81DB|nr:RsmB/NOP family class I SAM-dependent RNA methyltransferase [Methylovirgula sp. 4M-Z18]RFB80770.1 RsmB/NOP family class I SAM-dependent RNA methyltransferase [Methylovirgula sp. 4M-Z18]